MSHEIRIVQHPVSKNVLIFDSTLGMRASGDECPTAMGPGRGDFNFAGPRPPYALLAPVGFTFSQPAAKFGVIDRGLGIVLARHLELLIAHRYGPSWQVLSQDKIGTGLSLADLDGALLDFNGTLSIDKPILRDLLIEFAAKPCHLELASAQKTPRRGRAQRPGNHGLQHGYREVLDELRSRADREQAAASPTGIIFIDNFRSNNRR
ncbi:hypothetical protein JOF46_000822 [Paeniglutamicibacter psychrophenolicus]|uniref:Uncharacterized protein n=1 Tax=Paeniglutamicibacter psychrophenolicus TaxID=257454 RepID=A0ABS4W9P0_9MICC|nr:hypothetical protein [Paeniglutamicibacter psychrophenolicus]